MLIALIGMFAFHSFGAFASFELRLDNHWFTMHAVPVVVFSLCNTGLLSVALLVCAPVLCHLSAPDPLDSLHLTDVS